MYRTLLGIYAKIKNKNEKKNDKAGFNLFYAFIETRVTKKGQNSNWGGALLVCNPSVLDRKNCDEIIGL